MPGVHEEVAFDPEAFPFDGDCSRRMAAAGAGLKDASDGGALFEVHAGRVGRGCLTVREVIMLA